MMGPLEEKNSYSTVELKQNIIFISLSSIWVNLRVVIVVRLPWKQLP